MDKVFANRTIFLTLNDTGLWPFPLSRKRVLTLAQFSVYKEKTKAMKTYVNQSNIQPLWRETIQFSSEFISHLEKCKDAHFVRRAKRLSGKLTKTMLTALQSSPGTGLFDALANFHSHSTELSLMLIRAEGLRYTDHETSTLLMQKIYRLRQGIRQVQ